MTASLFQASRTVRDDMTLRGISNEVLAEGAVNMRHPHCAAVKSHIQAVVLRAGLTPSPIIHVFVNRGVDHPRPETHREAGGLRGGGRLPSLPALRRRADRRRVS